MLARGQTRFYDLRGRFEHHQPKSHLRAAFWELGLFLLKQAWACLFGGVLLAMVVVTHRYWPMHPAMARYDFLFVAALTLQTLLLAFRLETVQEAKFIFLFHVIGTVMEIFKTRVGSWVYPEVCVLRIGHVPLFSGFMYASVGSYLARTTRIMEMHYTRFPPRSVTATIALLIYINFFTHHFLPDARYVLFGLIAILFGGTTVYFKSFRTFRQMPLVLGFVLVALFLWLAENIATFAHIWVYPNQRSGWHLVSAGKMGAWLLLMVVSFILITLVHDPAQPGGRTRPGA